MQTRCKNHNSIIQKLKPQLQNLKTRFNRGAKNHNLELIKHNLMFSLPMVVMFFSTYFFAQNVFATATDSGGVKFNLQNAYSIEIVLPELDAMELTPTSDGRFASQNINIGVGTSNPSGYTLSMSAESTNMSRSAAVNNEIPTIPTLESAVSESNFPNNHWGFKRTTGSNVDSLYQRMSASTSIPLNTTSAAANAGDSNTNINFAVKLNNSLPAGTYSITLTFLAVANEWEDPITDISQIEYLQDFYGISNADKTTLLASMTENQAYSLKDNRDEQSYYVAKLADGNIWFLDNLRLDLTNSDVMTNLTPATTNASETALDCLTGRTTDCTSPYTTDAVSDTWDNTYINARINTTDATTINSDSSLNFGNGSHMYGVYYNYCAASAGSYCYDEEEGSPDGVNASEDICPAGWRMPTGDSTGEWDALDSLIDNRTASDSASIQARLSLPLSGYFGDWSVNYQGSYGYWWSSTRDDGDYMYLFGANDEETTWGPYDRYFGLPLRCLFSAS